MNPVTTVLAPEAPAAETLPEAVLLDGAAPALPGAARIEVLTATTPARAAAVVAALEAFLAEHAPTPNGSAKTNGHQLSGWHRQAIHDAVHARQSHLGA